MPPQQDARPRPDLLDETTEFGARAARRLREDLGGWLVTVSGDGTPQPIPIWFLWDGAETLLLYSRPGQVKLRNIERRPKVALHLDGNRQGGNIVVCVGEAQLSDDPPANLNPSYLSKYEEQIASLGQTPESFAELFSVAFRIKVTRIRGH